MNVISVPLTIECPKCGAQFESHIEMSHDDLVPPNCANIRPKGHATLYEISSADIQKYLQEKVRAYQPDGNVIIMPVSTEPRQRGVEQRHPYAIIVVAFSVDLVADNMASADIPDWLIPEGEIKLVKSVAANIIERYKLNVNDFNGSYRYSEDISQKYGIDSRFAEFVKQFHKPKLFNAKDSKYVAVALSAAKIIADMLSSKDTKKLEGSLFIQPQKVSDQMLTFSVLVREGTGMVTESSDVNLQKLIQESMKK